jgi:hypothetical protein
MFSGDRKTLSGAKKTDDEKKFSGGKKNIPVVKHIFRVIKINFSVWKKIILDNEKMFSGD